MKNHLLVLCITLLASAQLFAQKDFQVQERAAVISVGERTGYTVSIVDINEKELMKMLKNWIGEKQKKAEFEETGKHEIMVKGLEMPQLSVTPVDIYFLFEESKSDVKVTGFFTSGGAFMSSSTSPEKYKECVMFMRNFGMRTEKLKVMERLDVAQKELTRRQNDQHDLEKKSDQLNDQIEECNKTIEKATSDLSQNSKDQENKKREIAEQQATFDGIKKELDVYEGY